MKKPNMRVLLACVLVTSAFAYPFSGFKAMFDIANDEDSGSCNDASIVTAAGAKAQCTGNYDDNGQDTARSWTAGGFELPAVLDDANSAYDAALWTAAGNVVTQLEAKDYAAAKLVWDGLPALCDTWRAPYFAGVGPNPDNIPAPKIPEFLANAQGAVTRLQMYYCGTCTVDSAVRADLTNLGAGICDAFLGTFQPCSLEQKMGWTDIAAVVQRNYMGFFAITCAQTFGDATTVATDGMGLTGFSLMAAKGKFLSEEEQIGLGLKVPTVVVPTAGADDDPVVVPTTSGVASLALGAAALLTGALLL